MPPPRWRRAPCPLDPPSVARLVALRESGLTWKEIGLEFGKQDGALKQIYDRAKAQALAAE
jgi:hypothetical protein